MRLTLPFTLLVAGLARVGMATWLLNLYSKCCPKGDDSSDSNLEDAGILGGQAGQELWCMKVGPAHSGFVRGIDEDEMKVDLFSDWNCNNYIETWTTDGCFVTNSDDGAIEAVRILPKS